MKTGTIEVIHVTDHADGSATLVVEMSRDALIAFAEIGLHHALLTAAQKVIDDGEIAQEDPHHGDDDGGDGQAVQAAGAPAGAKPGA